MPRERKTTLKKQSKPKGITKSSENRALSIALNFIKYRPRSAMEVVKRLQKDKVEPNKINSVIEQLTKVRIIDDARFAQDWVRARDRLSPRGKFLLRQELQDLGITKDLIESTIDCRETEEWSNEIGLNFSDEPVDKRLAQNIVQKYLTKNSIETDKEKNRLIGKLARRGFSPNIVYNLVLKNENRPQE